MQLRSRFIEYMPYLSPYMTKYFYDLSGNNPQQKINKEDTIMFFDTETTGLFRQSNIPYMLQLSFILYDIKQKQIVKTYNEFIQIPTYVTIPEASIQVHGITQNQLDNQGIPIEQALTEFYHGYMNSSMIIGHNIQYDIQVIRAEILRNYDKMIELGCKEPQYVFQPEYQEKNQMNCVCTMQNTIDYCNLLTESKTVNKDGSKRFYKKYPKLSELYYSIFKEQPKNLHDALEDVKICMQCYLELTEKNGHIFKVYKIDK